MTAIRSERDAQMPAPVSHPFYDGSGNIKPLREIEREAIIETLRVSGGKIHETARRLGIARNTLYRKMDEFNITRKTKR